MSDHTWPLKYKTRSSPLIFRCVFMERQKNTIALLHLFTNVQFIDLTNDANNLNIANANKIVGFKQRQQQRRPYRVRRRKRAKQVRASNNTRDYLA